MKRFYSITAIAIVFLLPAISANAKDVLADINNLHVNIIRTGEEPNGLAWEKIQDEINGRLKQAGIKVFVPEPGVMYKLPSWPELKIGVCLLKLEQSQQSGLRQGLRPDEYVFHIQTLLAKNVYVEVKPALRQKADVWKTEPVMQAASAENTPAKVTEVVLEQVEEFISDYQKANHPNKRPSDTNGVSIVPKEQLKPAVESTPAEYKYVASKSSKVFHKSTCTWAKKIKPENLVRYKTREEAINDGKKPCQSCKP